MIVGRNIDSLDIRVKREWEYINAKYPTMAFNAQTWEGKPQGRVTGRNVLLSQEGIITTPRNYDVDYIKANFDAMVTYSVKFKEAHPDIKVYNTLCPANYESYHWLEEFKGYDEKIKGICSLQTFYNWGHPLDANIWKHKVMAELTTEPHLVLHTYGSAPFGKAGSYKGDLGYRHSNYHNLKKINEYLFCYAAEAISDPFWGHNYLTERVFNTFKSKTILIYYGATNVDELLPEHIFVNVRKFWTMAELSDYLILLSMDKKRYTEMVEEAYRWNLTTTLGDMKLQEEVFQRAVRENPL